MERPLTRNQQAAGIDARSLARPGFRLLAITPPWGSVDPGLVEAWRGAEAVGLAVGAVHDQAGRRVATATQECLMAYV